MGTVLWLIVFFLGADVLLIGALVIQRLFVQPTSFSISDSGPLLVAAGIFVALVTFLITLRRGRSEDLLDVATDLLEKAYNALSPIGEKQAPSQ